MKPSRYPVDIVQLVTLGDVCNALRVSRRTLQRMINTGAFPKPDRRIGRGLRWRRETVQRWIEGDAQT